MIIPLFYAFIAGMNETNTNAENPESIKQPALAQPAEAPASDSSIDIDHFAKVELRVAEVISVEAVPKSKKLLKLKVTLGDKLGERQILSGISQFYSPEALVGKRIIVVANLKPAKLMGLESQGMLLAGSNDDDSILAIVEPSAALPLGSRVR